jgi:biotin carboxyl carrier protein
MKTYTLTIDGNTYRVEVQSIQGGRASVLVNDTPYEVELESGSGATESGLQAHLPTPSVASPGAASATSSPAQPPPPAAVTPAPSSSPGADLAGPNVVAAPMPGLIIEVMVKVGDQVKRDQTLVRIEAMKMENDIMSPTDGVVTEVRAVKGHEVQENEILVVLST